MKSEHRHLWIIQQMIRFMKSSLKIARKMKKYFFIKQDISLFFKEEIYFLFLEKYFFKVPKNSFASVFFLPRETLKNIDMPRKNPRHFPVAEANYERCIFIKQEDSMDTTFFITLIFMFHVYVNI